MFCKKCGKEIMDEAVICPNCGCPTNGETNRSVGDTKTPTNESSKANLSMIFGILSLLCLSPFGIPAIILANMSKQETGGVMNGKAKAGLVCGIIALCFWGCAIIYYILSLA